MKVTSNANCFFFKCTIRLQTSEQPPIFREESKRPLPNGHPQLQISYLHHSLIADVQSVIDHLSGHVVCFPLRLTQVSSVQTMPAITWSSARRGRSGRCPVPPASGPHTKVAPSHIRMSPTISTCKISSVFSYTLNSIELGHLKER